MAGRDFLQTLQFASMPHSLLGKGLHISSFDLAATFHLAETAQRLDCTFYNFSACILLFPIP